MENSLKADPGKNSFSLEMFYHYISFAQKKGLFESLCDKLSLEHDFFDKNRDKWGNIDFLEDCFQALYETYQENLEKFDPSFVDRCKTRADFLALANREAIKNRKYSFFRFAISMFIDPDRIWNKVPQIIESSSPYITVEYEKINSSPLHCTARTRQYYADPRRKELNSLLSDIALSSITGMCEALGTTVVYINRVKSIKEGNNYCEYEFRWIKRSTPRILAVCGSTFIALFFFGYTFSYLPMPHVLAYTTLISTLFFLLFKESVNFSRTNEAFEEYRLISNQLMASQQKDKKNAIFKALAEKSKRVAHDIRSPLSALSILAKNSDELPEDKRNMLVAASDRISSIANELLRQSKETSNRKTLQSEMIELLIISILDEKKLEYRDRNVKIHTDLSYGGFSLIHSDQFRTIISNLINNSVEAGAKRINLKLEITHNLKITLSDDGCGIPLDTLEKIGVNQISTKVDGHGIGLSSAISSISSNGGTFEIESSEGVGTQITICLNPSTPPDWFLPSTKLVNFDGVAIIIDDSRAIWSELKDYFPQYNIAYFQSIDEFKRIEGQYKGFLTFLNITFDAEAANKIDSFSSLQNAVLIGSSNDRKLMQLICEKKVKFVPKNLLKYFLHG